MIYFVILTLIAVVVLVMGFLEFRIPFTKKKKIVEKIIKPSKVITKPGFYPATASENNGKDLMSAECAAFFKLPARIRI